MGLPKRISNQCGRVRGLTLIECLVFVSIWSAVSVTAMWSIRQAGLLRGNSSMRAELATIAQSELEHARALPASGLRAGSHVATPEDWWPAGTSCTVTLTPRAGGAWMVDVRAGRNVVRPIRPVRLVSFRNGAQ